MNLEHLWILDVFRSFLYVVEYLYGSLTTNYLPAKTGLEVTMIKATYKRECLIEFIVPEG